MASSSVCAGGGLVVWVCNRVSAAAAATRQVVIDSVTSACSEPALGLQVCTPSLCSNQPGSAALVHSNSCGLRLSGCCRACWCEVPAATGSCEEGLWVLSAVAEAAHHMCRTRGAGLPSDIARWETATWVWEIKLDDTWQKECFTNWLLGHCVPKVFEGNNTMTFESDLNVTVPCSRLATA